MPPPVPPPSPGPTPPPLPLPTPPPLPEPIPAPLPGPFESLITLLSGSPQLDMLGLAKCRSGGPITVGVASSLASTGLTEGGVNCVIENLGRRPLLAGCSSCAPPPPPPPATFLPEGITGL